MRQIKDLFLFCFSLGATLEIVTDKSQEGSQFVRGFGGVGGILRYKVDLQNLNVDEDAEPIDYSKETSFFFISLFRNLFICFSSRRIRLNIHFSLLLMLFPFIKKRTFSPFFLLLYFFCCLFRS